MHPAIRYKHRARTIALGLSAAAVAALGAPAVAGAAVTPAFDAGAKTATLTSDDDADAITLGVDGDGNLTFAVGTGDPQTDWDPSTDGPQTVPTDGSFTVTVNGGGGGDTVTASAVAAGKLAKLIVNGGAGNDLITGSAAADEINGDAGDDRLTGFKNGAGTLDVVKGGDGDDTIVWNNGDGSDTHDGEGGRDTTEVNGAATQGDVFTYKPGDSGRVRFDRTNLVPFSIDIGTTEVLDMNTLGGDDQITGSGAPVILAQLDGGVGVDTLTGGDGPDLIQGGAGNDVLAGGGQDDRIEGNRGADTVAGGEGSDTLVWNDGDGSDKMDGENGYDIVEVNGSVTAGDVFTVVNNNGRAKFDRTNLVPFSLDLTAEVLDVNGLGGDDTFTASDGAPLANIDVDGGSGNDTLTGASGNDTLLGAGGNDTLVGGGGLDALSGAEGDDTIMARDGAFDVVRGGAGNDTAQVDLQDGVGDVEVLDRPQPPVTPKANGARVTSTRITAKGRKATFRVACPAGGANCSGTLELVSAKTLRIGRVKVLVSLGKRGYNIAAGKSANVTVTLPSSVSSLPKSLKVRAIARTKAGDATISTTRTVTIRTRR